MPIFRLNEAIAFPDPELAEPPGIVAVGGDLSPRRVLAAYAAGIFPWPSEGRRVYWWSPDPRLVLTPAAIHVPRSLAKILRAGRFDIRLDTACARVIRRCGDKPRPGQDGTWITPAMTAAYEALHAEGFVHSAEAWQDGDLVGGLYGVSLGAAFFGESMFADRPDASKAAFATLVRALGASGFAFVDCQVTTEHLVRFGAEEIPRREFLDRLTRALDRPTLRGRWSLAADGRIAVTPATAAEGARPSPKPP